MDLFKMECQISVRLIQPVKVDHHKRCLWITLQAEPLLMVHMHWKDKAKWDEKGSACNVVLSSLVRRDRNRLLIEISRNSRKHPYLWHNRKHPYLPVKFGKRMEEDRRSVCSQVEKNTIVYAFFSGGTQVSFTLGGSALKSNPSTFFTPFWQRRYLSHS